MYDNKCPTCPSWGTGKYCHCGSSSMRNNLYNIIGCCVVLFVLLISCLLIVFNFLLK